MALYARTTAETVDFVSSKDPDYKSSEVPVDENDPSKGTRTEVTIGDTASRFKLKPLDLFLMAHIYDNASTMVGRQGSAEVGIKTLINKTNVEAVRFGLAGIPDNWADKRGTTIKFELQKETVNGREYSVVTDAVMTSLGLQLVQEMAEKIKELSEVGAAEAKN